MAELPSGTVTFFFTDIEGSTRLWEAEPDAMRVARARHFEILRDAVQSHGGLVIKDLGDGMFAVFATAPDGVAAAVAAQGALAAEPWREIGELRVRVGLHTAEAQHRDGDYHGPAVNRAARLMATAHGGQVVVSHTTQALVADALPTGVELLDRGEHRLRDLLRPEHVFEVRTTGQAESFPPLRSLDAFPGNLPVQLTSFVGRDDDLAGVGTALEESRLVTLTGVGGVGKTRLAVQVAAEIQPRFADGAWMCELAATNDAEMLGQVIVAALSVQPRPGRSLTESVCDYLSGKQALIVLDNCEHLIDAAAGLAEAILLAAPRVRVLATSREGLAVAGEQVWPLRSLRVASEPSPEEIAACEAARLFAERAAAARPHFVVDATNATAVAEICRRLDGIPLAVELAAARVTSMAPGEIAGLLDERFRLLTGGRRRGVERHHTLRATVEWSYSLLDERERVIFDRLGVFAGSFDADAATAVTAGNDLAAWDARDALDDLVAKSMIVLEDGPDTSARFRLLETLRQYALERLDDAGQTEAYRRRHAAYYATFAEMVGPGLQESDEITWARRFDAELDNLRAAVGWSLDAPAPPDAELGLRIIAALGAQAFCRPVAGVGEWAEAASPRAETSTPGRRTAVLGAAAWKAIIDGDLDLGLARASSALRDGLPPDTPSPAWTYTALASANAFAGDQQVALETLAVGERALDAIGADDANHLEVDVTRVVTRVMAGEDEEARTAAEDALRWARALANPSALIVMLRWFAATRRPDEIDDAVQALEECLAHGRAVATPHAPDVLMALGLLAKLRAGRGERVAAVDALREAVVRGNDGGHRLVLFSFVLNHGVSVAADLDAYEFAATLGAALTDGSLAELISVAPADRTDRQATLESVRSQLDPDRYLAAHAAGAAMTYEQVVDYTLTELDGLLAESAPGA